MNNRKIVLASRSPRRRDLLTQIGIKHFEIHESEYEEDMNAMDDPYELAKFLALKKGEDVARHYDDAIVISGDVFVIFEGKFVGKPEDEDDAKRILRDFSGKWHDVVTGYAIIDTKNKKMINDFGKARTKFRELTDEEIDDYVATKEPLEMAGCYGLLNRGAMLIEGIEGDFYSIIGLPLNKLYLGLKQLGVDVLKMQ